MKRHRMGRLTVGKTRGSGFGKKSHTAAGGGRAKKLRVHSRGGH